MVINKKSRFLRFYACAAICMLPGYYSSSKDFEDQNEKFEEKAETEDDESEFLESEKKYKLDLYNISKTYVLNSLRVWLELHLEEAHNVPFFSEGCEITRHIITGVEAGILQPYQDDECKNPMSKNDFLKNLRDPVSLLANDLEDNLGATGKNNFDSIPDVADRFLPRDISTVRLVVDFIIDSLRSVTHTRIMSVSVVIPPKKFATGLEKIVAHFDYRELMNYFATLSPDESWIDPKNSAGNKRFSDVFDKKHYWYPQSYLICTSEDKIRKSDPQNLDLRKISIDDMDYLLYRD